MSSKGPDGFAETNRPIGKITDVISEEDSDEVISLALWVVIGNWLAVEPDPLRRKRFAWAVAKAVEVAAELGESGDWISETHRRHPPLRTWGH
jgi:hypothetical protein